MSKEKQILFHNFQVSFLNIREGAVETINENAEVNSLIYLVAGEGLVKEQEKQIPLSKGKSYLIKELGHLTSTSTELLTLYKLSWLKEAGIVSVPLADQSPVRMIPLWEEVVRLQKGKSISEHCRFQAGVWSLLAALTEHTEVDRIEEAVDMIRSHLANPYSIAELAANAKMSPTSFSREFKKRIGMSPKMFLNEERMKAAKQLMLQNKGIITKDVAMQVGLQDEFYFSRLFKKKEGVAPTVYMKRSKERIAVISQIFLQDHLLSLGIQPVAAPSYPAVFPSSRGIPKYLVKELDGTLLLNAETTFNMEEILKTQPDRIIKTPLHNGHIQSVLLFNQQKVHHIPLMTQWNHYLREVASLVGKENKVDAIEREIHHLETKVKDELCPLTKKGHWAVLWIRSEEIRLYGSGNHACLDLIHQKLGFEPHPDLPNEGYKVVTLEELADLNIDKLLILWSHETDVWRVAQTSEWKKIRAVKNGNVYYPPSHEWDPWGPLGRRNMLQNFSATLQSSKLV